jgi:hypothetical protein
MTKLKAIWKIICSEHFILFTGGGGIYGIVRKKTKPNDFFDELSHKVETLTEDYANQGDGNEK